MANKYPKISNYLTYEITGDEVKVSDFLTDEIYILTMEEARYIRNLDGKTHPYDIDTSLTQEEIDEIICMLDMYDMLKTSNKTVEEGGTVMRGIWMPRVTPMLRITAFLCNKLLMVLWLPALILGIFLISNNYYYFGDAYEWAGYFLGIICGLVFHEFGHAFAAISYGAKVFEMGVMTMYYIMPGAYVLMDESSVTDRMKRVQIYAAGVETNILLTGIFLIMAVIFRPVGWMCIYAAICNAALAILNLALVKGLDGTAIISELLGIENVAERAFEMLLDTTERHELKKYGVSGKAAITACVVMSIFQIALPVILVLNVLEVLLCFI